MALEILGWSQEETRFPLGGRILFTQPNEGNSISNWKKSWTTRLGPIHALLAVLSSEELPEVSPKKQLIFPSNISSIKDASLVIVREKNAKNSPIRVSFETILCGVGGIYFNNLIFSKSSSYIKIIYLKSLESINIRSNVNRIVVPKSYSIQIAKF